MLRVPCGLRANGLCGDRRSPILSRSVACLTVGFVNTPRVLFVASECAGLVKTGGLADVIAALPKALADIGVDVRVMLPGDPPVIMALSSAAERVRLSAAAGLPSARLLEATPASGVRTYVLDCPELYARGGGPYQDENGRDWPDNARRFALLGRA